SSMKFRSEMAHRFAGPPYNENTILLDPIISHIRRIALLLVAHMVRPSPRWPPERTALGDGGVGSSRLTRLRRTWHRASTPAIRRQASPSYKGARTRRA